MFGGRTFSSVTFLTHLEGPFCLRRVLVFCAEDESQHLRHRTQRDGRLGLPPVVTAGRVYGAAVVVWRRNGIGQRKARRMG
ncbi:MAG TPA: hypothetical protein EYP56_22745 [Planctomycetaceae bacterium]|nr:hypothetical protein [Planctomycetaceae bacterium]